MRVAVVAVAEFEYDTYEDVLEDIMSAIETAIVDTAPSAYNVCVDVHREEELE